MKTLALALALLPAADPGGDDPAAALRTAVERLETSGGYGFEMRSEYHGGLGGIGSGRIGRPAGVVVGEVAPGRPLHLRFDSFELIRSSKDDQVYRRGDGAWRRTTEPLPRSRSTVSMLGTLLPPHELLRLALDDATSVTPPKDGAAGTWRIEVGPAATRALAGDLARERRAATGALNLPDRRLESRVVAALRDGAVREVDAELAVRFSAGGRERVHRRNVTYTLRAPAGEPPAVPTEAAELLGLSPDAAGADAPPGERDRDDEDAPAESGGEHEESVR